MFETCAAILTASGRGAVAVIRVWGPSALTIADQAFRRSRGRSFTETPAGQLRVGRMGAGLGDEVVVVSIARTDRETEVEVQCHGGQTAAQLVLNALAEAGARIALAEEWLATRGTANSIAAWLDLAKAPTLKTARILLDQAEGALDNAIRDLKTSQDANVLISQSVVGLRLVEGWRVVLAGRPNVGKSRLLNALAGYGRAIVDPTPGTTRDVVTFRTALDGWPVELVDTAGLREASEAIELSGIARARAEHAKADLILLVLDVSMPITDADHLLMQDYPQAVRVANKSDLPPTWKASEIAAVAVSAERGDGLDLLMARIVARLVPNPPVPGAAVPFRAEQVQYLKSLRFADEESY